MADFKNAEVLRRTCQEIADLEPDPWTGVVTAEQVMILLGERLDIWPATIADDVLADAADSK